MRALSILGWFSPPQLPHPDFRRRARALWLMSFPLLGIISVILGVAVVVEPATLWRRATTVGAVAGLMLLLHGISRRGRPVLASWILVIGLSTIVTQRAWITGGIHAPVAVFYAMFIIMAGLLLGARGGFVTALVCLSGATVLAIGTHYHWLRPRPGAGSVLGGFVFVVLAIAMAMLVQALVAARPAREALNVDTVRMLVHDMRSPMQILMTHLDLLRDSTYGERRKDVEGAIDGATAIHRMTNSLLDVSRLEAGRMPVHRIMTDVAHVARVVAQAARVLQPGRPVVVEGQDVMCNCDPELTRRIIENLVMNAVKHTGPTDHIAIVVAGSADAATITVSDSGPGVARDQEACLFEPFSGAAPLSANGFECSGLGLAFCRLAAEAQGGTIRFERVEPRGSRFVVTLPRV